MWQKWPPQSWHGMSLREAARVAKAYTEYMTLIEPLMKAGKIF